MKAPRESEFAYQAVYRYLAQLISEPCGEGAVRLPSLRELADRLNVSISTIQYAYSLLEKEGRVYSVAKSGYYTHAAASLMPPLGGGDLLETLYIHARRPGMRVLSMDDPASLQPLDSPLLMLERELLRQYPRQPPIPLQPCGELELRTVLAARYTTSPTQCWHAEDVYIGADLRGVLEILIRVLDLRNTTVIVESPCDWVILRLLSAAEVRVIELPLQAQGEIDLQQLGSLINAETVRLILLSSGLSMPFGSVLAEAHLRDIAQLLMRHDVWLLENDCHSELSDVKSPLRLRDLLDPDRLLVFSTLEKIMGAEAPYGFVLSRQWREALQRHFLLRAFRLSPIRQKAVARLYTSGRIDQHLHLLRRLLKERRTLLIQLLRERLGDTLHIIDPQGGATIWVCSRRKVDMASVFHRLLKQQVVIAPGELFSLQGLHADYLRLSPGNCADQELASVVGLLGDALRLAPGS
ncbi:aminotransferase class I/II-fold pyridoxal phosphate-dependent enzyme [Pseudomonas syringae]|nr:aminotransferase class I/II-fold pyridoxal phosphate-dependent enzyme [Pseudomonas syringae]MCF5068192.1 aminotransferase class I/II-fold pyridoxal phosphate-dependent enzyme [Pseudomonas syringae]